MTFRRSGFVSSCLLIICTIISTSSAWRITLSSPSAAIRFNKHIHRGHGNNNNGRNMLTETKMLAEPSLVVEAGSSVMIAAESWVGPAKAIVEPLLDLGGVAFLIRIILSWYPQIDLNKLPVNIIAWPTEPFLKATRVVVPPAFGVDISPIIWFAFLNFLREILVSDQGILTILQGKQ